LAAQAALARPVKPDEFRPEVRKTYGGFIDNYNICIEMARALTDWETANGGSRAYDDLETPWIEIVEHFVESMILRSIETAEIPNARFILNSVLNDGGAA